MSRGEPGRGPEETGHWNSQNINHDEAQERRPQFNFKADAAVFYPGKLVQSYGRPQGLEYNSTFQTGPMETSHVDGRYYHPQNAYVGPAAYGHQYIGPAWERQQPTHPSQWGNSHSHPPTPYYPAELPTPAPLAPSTTSQPEAVSVQHSVNVQIDAVAKTVAQPDNEIHAPIKPADDWENHLSEAAIGSESTYGVITEKSKTEVAIRFPTVGTAVKDSAKDGSGVASDSYEDGSSAPPMETDEVTETKAFGGAKGKGPKFSDPDGRPHMNVVFIGHVDAGKSTACGNILYQTGQVDQRTLEKYEREAREKNRESWLFAFIMDTNEEERTKGKTVEVGRALFSTANRRFTILDAPGHKSFVPSMISGAAQADLGILIISARKGEFETGFEKGGQTREHALLAKTLGVNQLIVAVNKMDDITCNWSEERYRDIERKLNVYLKSCGYNMAKDVTYIPISGLTGANVKECVADPASPMYTAEAAWYGANSPTLLQILDSSNPPERAATGSLRVPLLEGFKDKGVSATGKIESGTVLCGQWVVLMPSRVKVKVISVLINDEEMRCAPPGENVTLVITGVEEDAIGRGNVLCSVDERCPVVMRFKAQVMVIELLEHRPLLTAGYGCVLHIHTASEECQFEKLLEAVDRTTKKKRVNPPFVKGNVMLQCIIEMSSPLCMETFADHPQLGRFTLRDEGKTVGIGKVLEILA